MNKMRRNESGQALLELALFMPVLLVFVLGIVDFTRAVYDYQVITNLSGEGSSAASRGTDLPTTVSTIMNFAGNDINMTSNGCVVATSVDRPSAGSYQVVAQSISAPCNAGSNPSRIGCPPPTTGCGAANIPTDVQAVLTANPNQKVYITEVYYNFTAITPIGYFLHNSSLLPSRLYSVAYY